MYAPPTDPMQGVKSTDGATADQTAVAVSANPSADRKLPTTDKTLDPTDALVDTTTMKTSPSAGQADHDTMPDVTDAFALGGSTPGKHITTLPADHLTSGSRDDNVDGSPSIIEPGSADHAAQLVSTSSDKPNDAPQTSASADNNASLEAHQTKPKTATATMTTTALSAPTAEPATKALSDPTTKGLDQAPGAFLETCVNLYEKSLFDHLDTLAPAELSYLKSCLLYTSPSPRDTPISRMPSSA